MRRRCCARPRRVSWMSPWPAASKPSNTLRECSVICVEPALENIGWDGGPPTDLNGATTRVLEQSLFFRFCNSSLLQLLRFRRRLPQVRCHISHSSVFRFAPLRVVDPSNIFREPGLHRAGLVCVCEHRRNLVQGCPRESWEEQNFV